MIPIIRIPTSPVFDLIGNTLNNCRSVEHLDALCRRDRIISKGKSDSKYILQDGRLIFLRKSGSGVTKLYFNNIPQNKPTIKFLVFFLSEINRKLICSGKIKAFILNFDAEQLVKIGLYKSVKAAVAGIEKQLQILESITVVTAPDVESCKVENSQRIILSHNRKGRRFSVQLNSDFPWGESTKHFATLPDCFYTLGNRSSVLMYYCCYLARQNIRAIKTDGYFEIGLRGIQSRLSLPDEDSTKSPKTTIREPIWASIDEINSKNSDIKLELSADESLNTYSYLDNGKIRVHIKGEIKAALSKLKKTREVQTDKKGN